MTKYITLVLLLLIANVVFATSFTVKQTGGGDFTTIQACATAMANGDTCTVFAGTYNENVAVTAGGVVSYKTFNVNGTDVVNVLSFTIGSHNKLIGFHIQNPTSPNASDCVSISSGSTDVYVTSNVMYACGLNAMIEAASPSRASHVFVQNNVFSYAGTTSTTPDTHGYGIDAFGDYWLIEGNDFSHIELGIVRQGSFGVVRSNTFHDFNRAECTAGPTNCHSNSWFAEPSSATQFNLYENNTSVNWLGADTHVVLAQGNVCGGLCHHLIIRYNAAAHLGETGIIDDNSRTIGVNPGFYYVKSYNNTWADAGPGTVSGFTFNSTNGASVNDIYYYPGSVANQSPYICSEGGAESTCSTFAGNHNLAWCVGATCTLKGRVYQVGNFTDDTGNLQQNPLFVNYSSSGLGDLHLQPGSPARGAGGSLTTVSSGCNTSSLTLVDATYFQDGYGLTGVQPDWLRIGVTTLAQVSSVNYSTNVVTFGAAVSCTNGDPVYLYKDSSGTVRLTSTNPDIGALPFALGPNPPTGLQVLFFMW